jgi:RNA polymerase sigma-70 factor (ECF subfamily)
MVFNEIYTQNYRSVFILAFKILKDDEASKDIAQEVFLSLHQILKNGKLIQNPQGWLNRATWNRCLNYLRDSRKRNACESSEINQAEDGIDSKIIEAEEVQMIKQQLGLLREKEQIIINLYCEGMSYKEIAEISGLPFNSVGNTLARSLTKLKKRCHVEKK